MSWEAAACAGTKVLPIEALSYCLRDVLHVSTCKLLTRLYELCKTKESSISTPGGRGRYRYQQRAAV